MNKLLSRVALLAALALGLWGMWERSSRMQAEKSASDFKAKWHGALADARKQALETSERYRALEEQMRLLARSKQHDIDQARARHDDEVAAIRSAAAADARSMRRSAFAAATCSTGGPAEDSASASGRDPAAGDVLEALLQLAGEHTAAAEHHADQARDLRDGWTEVSEAAGRLIRAPTQEH